MLVKDRNLTGKRQATSETNKPTLTLGKQQQQPPTTKVFKHALKNTFSITQFLLSIIDYIDFRRPKTARSKREYNMKAICNKQKELFNRNTKTD